MKNILILFFALTFSLNSHAGNGVERGSVKVEGTSGIQAEIGEYLKKELTRCSSLNEREIFHVENLSERRERIDNGITDVYYMIKIQHLDKNRTIINNLTIEILDSDFHNWRHYEEKLFLEIITDQNQMCNL